MQGKKKESIKSQCKIECGIHRYKDVLYVEVRKRSETIINILRRLM